ncbi:hypothetical protein B0H10DRAFT_270509 [Mycena sp. CBHHK59/15]|nr:hypothetical protein B0H10DRAFT_270509 [Mycena sp. CBHHK59/15]
MGMVHARLRVGLQDDVSTAKSDMRQLGRRTDGCGASGEGGGGTDKMGREDRCSHIPSSPSNVRRAHNAHRETMCTQQASRCWATTNWSSLAPASRTRHVGRVSGYPRIRGMGDGAALRSREAEVVSSIDRGWRRDQKEKVERCIATEGVKREVFGPQDDGLNASIQSMASTQHPPETQRENRKEEWELGALKTGVLTFVARYALASNRIPFLLDL